jgi:hypothetical protein
MKNRLLAMAKLRILSPAGLDEVGESGAMIRIEESDSAPVPLSTLVPAIFSIIILLATNN